MIDPASFVTAAGRHGFAFWSGVPCSYLQPFINYVIADKTVHYVPANNEGDAVAFAAGVSLAGKRAVVMMQNSGLGNAVNPLTSLAHTHQLPMLLIVTLRGEPGGPADEPQHELMGRITTSLLEQMEIPWEYFPTDPDQIDACLTRSVANLERSARPVCLVMRKGSVSAWPEPPALPERPIAQHKPEVASSRSTSRRDMLAGVQAASQSRDLIVATTGYTGRELYALEDRTNQFYLVGAMGCAAGVGLGLALACPQHRVIVLDGDGAILMRMGVLAAVGYQRPLNLLHIVLDNAQHESTGGQSTVSGSLRLTDIASACGYPRIATVTNAAELRLLLDSNTDELTFIRALITSGVTDKLPRPAVSPVDTARRLRQHIQSHHALQS